MGAVLAALAFIAPALGDGVRATFFAIGISAILFGGAGALFAHRDVRAQAALDRGDDLVARWTVDPATWRAFVAGDARSASARGAWPNELSMRDDVPAPGAEVVVGRDAIEVDGSVHALPRRGTPEVLSAALIDGEPDVVELRLHYPGGGHGASGVPQGPTRLALRFPVAIGSRRDAHGVVAYYSGGRPAPADLFHGPGDGSDPEDLNSCASCGYETFEFRGVCPRCGGGMATRRWARRFGALLTACGLVLTGGMAYAFYALGPLLAHPGRSIGGSRFDGTAAEALAVVAILGAVLAFGLTALGYGAWQVKTGRRNLRVVGVMLAIWSALIAVAHWV
ncbi:MAG: hypothetical protein ABI585_01280 [Betaproteobacteria bacterium]